MSVPMKAPAQGDIMESVIAKGDLGKLTPEERVQYYNAVCKSLGLNPLTQPFQYITLNGKLTLYATRACADQLRKINGVSLEIVSREVVDDILTIHVRARMPDGRVDEELGAVAYASTLTLRGDARANAELKAVTKAKRRATLSICGLGWLDETEIADIPASAKRPAPPAKNVMIPQSIIPPHDDETGEVIEEIEDSTVQTEVPHGGAPAPFESQGDGAGVPTAVEYVKQWRTIKEAATNAAQLAATWKAQNALRDQIEWNNQQQRFDLHDEISKAVKFLKANP